MTKIKYFTNYLYIFVGLTIIMYMIYIRIFLKRVPKDLYIDFNDPSCYMKLIFLVISIIISLYTIIINIKFLYDIQGKNTWLRTKLSKISIFIDESLKKAFSLIMSLHKDNYDLLSSFYDKFYTKMSKYPETCLLFTMYFIRFFIAVIFLSEVLVLFKLNVFYKVLILLCVVLFIKLILFIMRDFASNVISIEEALIIEDNGFDKETQLPITNYSLKPEYEDNDLDYLVHQYILCNKLSGYLSCYDTYSNYCNPRVNIIIYSLYLIGWTYVLLHNL